MTRKLADQLQAFLSRENLAPEEIASRAQWIEIVIMSALSLGLVWLLQPEDPTLSEVNFPWLWLVPMLIALRYGVMPGLLSGMLVIVNTLVAAQIERIPGFFPIESLLGGGVITLLCGEFSDVWRDRNLRMEESYLYVSERLARLTKRHLLLNQSHDRLEQELLARPGSLRDALVKLRSMALDLQNQKIGTHALPGSNEVLQLLTQYVNIEVASIYLLKRTDVGYKLGEKVSQLGQPEPLDPDDELLELVLESNNLAHIAGQEVSLRRRTRQLVIAPLIAGNEEMVAVLAVTRMPFFALNTENLQILLVLLGYYADILQTAPRVASIQQKIPEMPFVFADELGRMLRLAEKIAMTSHVVVLRFHHLRGDEIAENMMRIKRSLDLYWRVTMNDIPVMVVLLPFASRTIKDGFLNRIEGWLEEHFRGDFDSLEINVQSVAINRYDDEPIDKLARALRNQP
jgi:hypothetical protein